MKDMVKKIAVVIAITAIIVMVEVNYITINHMAYEAGLAASTSASTDETTYVVETEVPEKGTKEDSEYYYSEMVCVHTHDRMRSVSFMGTRSDSWVYRKLKDFGFNESEIEDALKYLHTVGTAV